MANPMARFMWEFYSHWAAAWLGTVSLIVGIVLWATGYRALSWAGFTAMAFICVLMASYQIWNKKEAEIRTLNERWSTPKLFLRHADPPRRGLSMKEEMSGFFLQVEGENKAFNVHVTSPDAVGQDHTRLEMHWGKITVPIGNDPVPISALCSTNKGTKSSSLIGSQLEAYMKMKASEPKELIATVNYTDVDGKPYPVRKFRVYRERDITGDFITHCNVVND